MAYRLAGFLKEFVDPVVDSSGWSRKGQVITKQSDLGDFALIEFQRSLTTSGAAGEGVSFYVTPRSVPRPLFDAHFYTFDQAPRDRPDNTFGLALGGLGYRVLAPRSATADPNSRHRDDRWWFDPNDRRSVLRCGNALLQELSRSVLPTLERFLDRAELMSALVEESGSSNPVTRFCAAMFALDRGELSGLDELLVGDWRALEWARNQLAMRRDQACSS